MLCISYLLASSLCTGFISVDESPRIPKKSAIPSQQSIRCPVFPLTVSSDVQFKTWRKAVDANLKHHMHKDKVMQLVWLKSTSPMVTAARNEERKV